MWDFFRYISLNNSQHWTLKTDDFIVMVVKSVALLGKTAPNRSGGFSGVRIRWEDVPNTTKVTPEV